jgi:5-methylcytosine-specific restriction endonuclease McrA
MQIPSASNPLLHWDPAASDPSQRRIHPVLRGAVLDRDGWACAYCGRPTAEVDHVAPRGRGGPTVAANLVAACRRCNREKGLRTPTEWRFDKDLERIRRNARKRRTRNRPQAVRFRRG